MTEDEATLINASLTDIGAGPMFSVDDDSDLAAQIDVAFAVFVKRVFGIHDWSFCRKTFKNVRLAAVPENGWAYGFDLPGNRIGNPRKILDQAGQSPRPLKHFTIEEGKLFCNVDTTWSQCKVYVRPEYWPPEWYGACVVALGGYLAVPVWQDEDLREGRLVEAFGTPSREGTGGLFGRLMAQDRASEPMNDMGIEENPLINARTIGTGADYPWHGSL